MRQLIFCLRVLFSAVYPAPIFMQALHSALCRKRLCLPIVWSVHSRLCTTQYGVYILYVRTEQLQQNVARKHTEFSSSTCIACVGCSLSGQIDLPVYCSQTLHGRGRRTTGSHISGQYFRSIQPIREMALETKIELWH